MIPGAYPFASEPLSSPTAAEDTSSSNPLTRLLSMRAGELAFLLRATVGNPDGGDGAETTVLLSSSGYATLGDGAGAAYGIADHEHFPEGLSAPYSIKVSLLSGGTFRPSAVPSYGTIVVPNPEGRYDYLTRYDWELRPLTVWIGPRQWIGPSFADFGTIFQGTVEALSWDFGQITIEIRDLTRLLEADANPDTYLGFGTAVRLRAAGDKVTVAHHASLEPVDGGGHRLVAFEVMLEVPELHDAVIATKGGTAGWRAVLWADGAVGLFDRDVAAAVSPAGTVQAGVPVRLSFSASPGGLWIHADGEEVAHLAVPYGAPVSTADLIIGAGA